MSETRKKNYRWILIIIGLLVVGMALLYFWASEQKEEKNMELETGGYESVESSDTGTWKPGPGAQLANRHCTPCHSAELVTQNHMSADGWEATIRWMQKTQNLWDLGEDEGPLIEYLAKNYAPQFEGRRKPLSVIDWYALED